MIRGYRMVISPLFLPVCRYQPTCSQYIIDAVQRYGVVRGGKLGLCRLLRCHPFHPGGYDPVPLGLYTVGKTSIEDIITDSKAEPSKSDP
ncbi:membrane protein insertion efficiency factor YidD [Okeania sp. SIO2G5]|uniref:membrane protein insertion efficiency factor YidD n=1 Tax=Okeania sp. SIO2G5 TaxID=2607796 RepID=UPI0025797ED3|nr:membrane protein insertion efficiency factor YidD [Okeania sp. SIO2G5]